MSDKLPSSNTASNIDPTNSDKAVVVTGCSSGIGKATAELLSERGYQVVATVRQLDDAKTLSLNESCHIVELDLADEASVTTASDRILSLVGDKLYALFNNAAYGQPGAVEDLSRSALREQFEVNFFGTHQLTRALIPAMLERERAHIIQCSSILGLIGMPMRGAYVASKFALEGLSDTLRMELSETNIQVNLIEPGPIESQFRANALAALERNVDFKSSRHGWRYEAALKRLKSVKSTSSSSLGPESVAEKVVHALEAERAHRRYFVTRITYLAAFVKRFGPSSLLDWVLIKYAKKE